MADYRRGLSFIDEAFDRVRRAGACVLPCARGCSSCCSAVFDLPRADASLLRSWLAEQQPELRARVQRRAAEILAAVEAAAAGLAREGETALAGWDARREGLTGLPASTVTRLAERSPQPCPLVGDEGECLAHESRPALCRLGGLPWRDPVSGAELPDFCRLEEGMGENPAQELDLGRLDGLRQDFDEAIRRGDEAARGLPSRSFVAAVLAPPKEA